MVCCAIAYGAVEKYYLCEFFSLKVYYLNLLQLWVTFEAFLYFIYSTRASQNALQ
jgi:hypothetical protein